MHNPDHPVWPLLRLAVLMAAMVGVLWINSSQFDETEVKSIGQMFLIAASTEGLLKRLSKSREEK